MPQGHDVVLDVLEDFGIGLNFRARVVFLADHHGRHGIALESLSNSLEHGNSDFLIGGSIQPIGVDDGQIGSIRRFQSYITSRRRRNQHTED